mmetsp:Transcript_13547/g.50723  ORF Transcript_13547/g.50723 Transcript_13547/m.50723 type:complete len:432 (-) Transcript_13547:289-1584(-)
MATDSSRAQIGALFFSSIRLKLASAVVASTRAVPDSPSTTSHADRDPPRSRGVAAVLVTNFFVSKTAPSSAVVEVVKTFVSTSATTTATRSAALFAAGAFFVTVFVSTRSTSVAGDTAAGQLPPESSAQDCTTRTRSAGFSLANSPAKESTVTSAHFSDPRTNADPERAAATSLAPSTPRTGSAKTAPQPRSRDTVSGAKTVPTSLPELFDPDNARSFSTSTTKSFVATSSSPADVPGSRAAPKSKSPWLVSDPDTVICCERSSPDTPDAVAIRFTLPLPGSSSHAIGWPRVAVAPSAKIVSPAPMASRSNRAASLLPESSFVFAPASAVHETIPSASDLSCTSPRTSTATSSTPSSSASRPSTKRSTPRSLCFSRAASALGAAAVYVTASHIKVPSFMDQPRRYLPCEDRDSNTRPATTSRSTASPGSRT